MITIPTWTLVTLIVFAPPVVAALAASIVMLLIVGIVFLLDKVADI